MGRQGTFVLSGLFACRSNDDAKSEACGINGMVRAVARCTRAAGAPKGRPLPQAAGSNGIDFRLDTQCLNMEFPFTLFGNTFRELDNSILIN